MLSKMRMKALLTKALLTKALLLMNALLPCATALLWGAACKQTSDNGAQTESLSASAAAKETEIFIASGAGYRRPVDELKALYESRKGIAVNCIYGNMKQVAAQVKNSGKVSLVIGDAKFLKKMDVPFKK